MDANLYRSISETLKSNDLEQTAHLLNENVYEILELQDDEELILVAPKLPMLMATMRAAYKEAGNRFTKENAKFIQPVITCLAKEFAPKSASSSGKKHGPTAHKTKRRAA